MFPRPPVVDATKILTRQELALVLDDLQHKSLRFQSAALNKILVRLACCCGLRVSEIAQLQLGDVRCEISRPHLRIRRGAAKGGRPRMVPLWWDAGTLADLQLWKERRHSRGARLTDPFVCSLRDGCPGSLSRHTLRRRFRTACRVLGLERLQTLTIHHGRHTFISHALAGQRTLAEVRDAAGHANVSITSAYLHIAVDDTGEIGQLFGYAVRK